MTVDPVVVEALTMSYGATPVLHGLDLRVHAGGVVAVLGPNGAGKTTAIEILEGFRHRTGGSVAVFGADPQRAGREWRARIGIVLQSSATELELTARERLRLYAGYFPRPRDPDRLLGLIGLTEQRDVRCGRLSGGQLRRLDVALALVGAPDLVFLDEPTTGFDPASRRAAWDLIDQLRRDGLTILLTTHQMEEAQRLADRIAVVAGGRVVAEGSPADLVREYRRRHSGSVVITCRLSSVHHGQTMAVPKPDQLAATACESDLDQLTVHTDEPLATVVRLDRWASEQALTVDDLQVRQPSLEDAYLALTTQTPEADR
jgi:ABC-2 type transport system ATP-binding protein